MSKKNLFLKSVLAVSITAGLAACGGGGSSSDSTTTQDTETGNFVDSPVQGLRYFTSSGTGVTTAQGKFEYQDGDEIFFLIGNTVIGQSEAGPLLTPLDVAGDAANADKSTNILRFLQTLDENGNPSDGIVIPENVAVLAGVQGNEVKFDLPAEEFELQTSVRGLVSESGKDGLVTADAALNHFETTLKKLGDNEVDIRGEWITTSVYKQDGQTLCSTGNGTWTYTGDGLSFIGKELNPDSTVNPINCGIKKLEFIGGYDSAALSDPGMGCTGGICTLDQLNTVIPNWEEETRTWTHDIHGTIHDLNYSVVELIHRRGSDTMRRIKTDIQESTIVETGETAKQVFGVFETTFLKKEAHDYTKDMRGTWEITATRSACPDVTAVHTLTYSDTGITAVGEELNFKDGSCVAANINEVLAYDAPGLPEEFCGPVCSYSELNGIYSDEGDTIKLSHKRGTNKINRTKGLDSREVWVKTN